MKVKTSWEMFLDISYFDMWAVRCEQDTCLDSERLFHFLHKEDAERFLELVRKSNPGEVCEIEDE
jgi:hypothetical protein